MARHVRNLLLLMLPPSLALAWLGFREMTTMAATATLMRTIPPIDAAAPRAVETATFALG
ncbi:MAG TPA: hypothetical protein PLE19_05800 [Planctomycetota bacterium]|nr:hypothetical protein [Planctomycetota bacterium]HRR82597.1 hypothetical protein [Planctomycetota bacterium]